MTIRSTRFPLRGVALAAVLAAGSTHAATTWNLTSSSLSGVSVSGVTINGSNWSSSNIANYGGGVGGGLGVVNRSEDINKTGPHSADNYSGIDALVLSFTNQVSLTGFTIGWNGTDNPTTDCITSSWWGCTSSVSYNDSDMSVYAWSGASGSAPTSFAPSAAGSGWTLIGNYYNVGASNGVGSSADKQGGSASFTTATSSSYWMISALGTGTGTCGTHNDSCIDAFKLLSVAGTVPSTPPGVPEPGSLALLGLGALGLVAARRKSVACR